MRKSILAFAAGAAAVLTFGAMTAAQASVVGTLSDGNGTAGYYTNSFADIYTQVDGTFKLNLPAVSNLPLIFQNGGIGIELCNSTTGYTAQLGVIADAATGAWLVVVDHGFYKFGTGLNGDPCDGNSLFDEKAFGHPTALGEVPAGTTIQAQIKEGPHGIGLIYTVADSALANFNYFLPSFPGFFNEAGAGVTTDIDVLSAPATNDLVDFSGVTATDITGATHGLAYWNAVEVTSGFPGYAPLITPTAITPSGYVCTTVKGHWKHLAHHHKKWIKEKTTCTGGGASSFSILTGSPVGVL